MFCLFQLLNHILFPGLSCPLPLLVPYLRIYCKKQTLLAHSNCFHKKLHLTMFKWAPKTPLNSTAEACLKLRIHYKKTYKAL